MPLLEMFPYDFASWVPLLVTSIASLIFIKLFGIDVRQYIRKLGLINGKSQLRPPHFKGLPFLGNALQIVKSSWPLDIPPETHTLQAISGICHVFQKQGIAEFDLGKERMVLLFKAEYVEKLLTSNTLLEKSDLYKYFAPWLKEGLISSPKIKWKKRRKMLTPTFHFKILDDFQPLIFEKTQILVDILKSKLNQQFIEIDDVISLFTMDVICETAIGLNIDVQKNKDDPYVIALKKLGQLSFRRLTSPWLWPDTLFRLAPTGKTFYKCLDIVNALTKKVISERKQKFSENKEALELQEDEFKKVRHAFLDLLVIKHLQDESVMDEEGIIEEVNTFMFAGQDTTSVGIIWTLFLLGHNPEIQEKLYSEIEDVFGSDKEGDITIEHLKKLPYLDCVLKESQRIYPPVPLYGRTLTEDLDLGDYTVPKGNTCTVHAVLLHQDEAVFPDPLIFQPDRFLKENSVGRNPFAFVPFSAGPRNCIGQRFALNEEKTAVVNILRNFKIESKEPFDKIPICPELVSRPSKKIKMIFTNRQ